MRTKESKKTETTELTDVEMLNEGKKDSYHLAKKCLAAFDAGGSLATGRLMCLGYNTMARMIRYKKRYNVTEQ